MSEKELFDAEDIISKIENDIQEEFIFEGQFPVSRQKYKYKPIYTQLTKKILKYSNKKDNREAVQDILDILIKDTCLTPIDIDEMYLGDRTYYLFELRKNSQSSTFDVTETCPECKSQFIQTIDLSKDFKVKEFSPENFDPLIKISKNYMIELEMLKRIHSKEAFKFVANVEKQKGNKVKYSDEEKAADFNIAMLAISIKKIFDKDTEIPDLKITDKINLLSKIPQSIVQKIGEWHKEHSYGINEGKIIIKCPHCLKYEKEINIFDGLSDDEKTS